MGSLKALSLAALVAFGAIGTASAADLLPPPPPLAPMPMPVDFGGWYLRGDVGVGINQLTMRSSIFTFPANVTPPAFTQFNSASLGDSTIIGAGVGYQFNNWFRADITGEYRTAAAYRSILSYPSFPGQVGCAALCYDTYTANISSAVFLLNGYFDMGTWYGITPFVGGGVGLASIKVNGLQDISPQPAGGFGFASDTRQTNFAWALMAGLGYTVSPNLKLEMGYRYLDMGTANGGAIVCQNDPNCGFERQRYRLTSHDIRIGMRWMLSDGGSYAAPPPAPFFSGPPPGPLVRKY